MSTKLVTGDVWKELSRAIRRSKRPCSVAVAYLGSGANRLMPLPYGSRLVVDASEHAVASGQTCPEDLGRLLERGVRVYSTPSLHAKVFLVSGAAYVGSANASRHSANQLVEAILRTTEPAAISAAREFVLKHCLHELGPEAIRRLAKLYRPPRIYGVKHRKSSNSDPRHRPALPRLLVTQSYLEDWSAREVALHDSALGVAIRRRKHPHSFELDSFRLSGNCPYQRGDVIVQIMHEDHGRVLVTPPGNVLHVRRCRIGRGMISFVYLERPDRRWRQLRSVAHKLGRGALKRLKRNSLVRDATFAQSLLSLWRD